MKLIYAYDPCCGWCYGLVPAMRRLRAELPELEVEVRLGGLFVGEGVRPLGELRAYIQGASKRLAAVTGQQLSRAFFEELLPRFDVACSSLPPSAAVVLFRELAPGKCLEFCHLVLERFFVDARDQNDLGLYPEIARELGVELRIEPAAFARAESKALLEFEETARIGVRGFPTILAVSEDGRAVRVASEYEPERFVAAVRAALAEYT